MPWTILLLCITAIDNPRKTKQTEGLRGNSTNPQIHPLNLETLLKCASLAAEKLRISIF